MKKALLTFAALAVALCAGAQSRMATEAWVTNYVASALSAEKVRAWSENGTNYTAYGNIVMASEAATEYGMLISEGTAASRSAGITNGMLFAMVDDAGIFARRGWVIVFTTDGPYLSRGVYTNGAVVASLTAYPSRRRRGETWFVDPATNNFARVSTTLLQPGVAEMIRRGGL